MTRTVLQPIAAVLTRQLFRGVILCVLLFSSLQAWLSYRASEHQFAMTVQSVAETHLPLLSVAIWDIEPQAIEKQMGLLLKNPDITKVAIYTRTGKVFVLGNRNDSAQVQTVRLDIPAPEISHGSVGTLELVLDKSSLQSELLRNVLIAVLEILVLGLVLLIAVATILKRDLEYPLHELADYVRNLEANRLGAVFKLSQRKTRGYNEIDLVVDGFREMQRSLQEHIQNQDRLVAERTAQLEKAMESLKNLSNTDALTGVYNRQYFNEQMPAELTRAQRYGRPLSVIFCDIDFFKRVNDSYGHAIGDRVLVTYTKLVSQCLRTSCDWMVRYGGEEFILILPETALAGATDIAERIRLTIEAELKFYLEDGRHLSVTSSFGVAELDTGESVENLIRRADQYLYEAKENGRNQVRPAPAHQSSARVYAVPAPVPQNRPG